MPETSDVKYSSRLKLQDRHYAFALVNDSFSVMGKHCDLRFTYDEAKKFWFELSLMLQKYADTKKHEPINYAVDKDIPMDDSKAATCSWLPDLPKGFKIEEE